MTARRWLPHPAATIRPQVPTWCPIRDEHPIRTHALAMDRANAAGLYGATVTPTACQCGGYHLDTPEES